MRESVSYLCRNPCRNLCRTNKILIVIDAKGAQALRAAGQPVVAGLVLRCGAPRASATVGGAQSLATAFGRVAHLLRNAGKVCSGAVRRWRGGQGPGRRMTLPRDRSRQTTAACRNGCAPPRLVRSEAETPQQRETRKGSTGSGASPATTTPYALRTTHFSSESRRHLSNPRRLIGCGELG